MVNVKVPPSDIDAEKSVLGAILIDKEAINSATEILRVEDFYDGIHGTIFDAMLSLYEERKPIDIVTLTATLKKKKKYTDVGGSYIADLVNTVPTAANVEHYARIIKEASTKRSLISMSTQVSSLC